MSARATIRHACRSALQRMSKATWIDKYETLDLPATPAVDRVNVAKSARYDREVARYRRSRLAARCRSTRPCTCGTSRATTTRAAACAMAGRSRRRPSSTCKLSLDLGKLMDDSRVAARRRVLRRRAESVRPAAGLCGSQRRPGVRHVAGRPQGSLLVRAARQDLLSSPSKSIDELRADDVDVGVLLPVEQRRMQRHCPHPDRAARCR